MGVVYKVEHVHIGKLMAMKLLHGELARDRDTQKRFRREAEAVSHLSHHNTVQIFDFGRDEGLMFLVMEYVDGRDLGWLVQSEGPLGFAYVARVCAQVAASVGEAHSVGIIHRDLKPENIMVVRRTGRPDFVKVLDFGLAKLRHHESTITLTRAGSIIGTPYYMAPEHIRGEAVDARSDVYALGAVVYKALTGTPPFSAPSPVGVLTKHLTDPLELPSARAPGKEIPPIADELVQRAMAKEPADRFQSMEEIRDALLQYLQSIGEEVRETSMGLSSGRGSSLVSGRNSLVAVATRDDVDSYERRIRRKGLRWLVLGGLALVALVAGLGWFAGGRVRTESLGAGIEREPNNEAADAALLPVGETRTGYIGMRQTARLGDADVWRVENPRGDRRPISFSVTALPNMDLAVDLVKAGVERPVLIADSGGVGEVERVPNFPLVGSLYFLRVREVAVAGDMPTENVSDRYTIRWDYAEVSPTDETEVNDSLELGELVGLGEERLGYIGWAGDLDVYCLRDTESNIVATVGGVPGLDLVLRSVDRGAAHSRKFDEAGVGEAEVSRVVSNAEARSTCFEVSASVAASEIPANAEVTYRLELRGATEAEIARSSERRR